jgi:hypothetical protein
MENQVLSNLIENLYAEPGFSDHSPQDISRETKIPMKSLRGVLGSLSKKGYIFIHDKEYHGSEMDIVYLSENFYHLHPQWKDDYPYEFPNGEINEEKLTYDTIHIINTLSNK